MLHLALNLEEEDICFLESRAGVKHPSYSPGARLSAAVMTQLVQQKEHHLPFDLRLSAWACFWAFLFCSNKISMKIPGEFFIEIEKILKFTRNKKTPNSKCNIEQEEQSWRHYIT